MAHDVDAILQDLQEFLKNNFPMAAEEPVEPDDDLIDEGIVDSLGLLTVVDFLESTYGISVEDTDVVVENFGTMRAIAEYVHKSQQSAG